jgi:transcriptional regulator with XRE-family HTH domain
MRATVKGMTLQTLLQQHGITTIREFAKRAELSRQHAWNLWHAQVGLGTEMLKRLHERLGIPLEALIQVDPVPAAKRPRTTPPQPRGRSRKAPQSSPLPPPKEDA